MATFYVGQRVRVARLSVTTKFPHILGAEGVVNELDCMNGFGRTGMIGLTAIGKSDWCLPPEDLEPILSPPSAADLARAKTLLENLPAYAGEVIAA